MKRKVVVKVYSMNGHKSRSKALKVVVGVSGVESVTLKEMDQIEVTGDNIDAVTISTLLRKKVGCTELVAVAPVEEKKPELKTAVTEMEPQPSVLPSSVPYGTTYVQEIYNDEYPAPACCSIM